MTKGRIAFQGELGANSHEACVAAFPEMQPVPHATFEEAFEAVKSGDCQLGMIPVENSIAGRVADVHHLLPSSGLRIVGERFKPIHFQLMANPGVKLEDIKTVTSMPIALVQCRKTIRRLKLKTQAVGDTALAAKLLAAEPDPTRAAISPALAAELYGLEILARDIEDEHHNTTRFLVMTADKDPAPPPFTTPCVTSFVFRVRNLPAALYKAMGGFA
ncbi:prephenate dehydratase domain-containing protein, partial [Phenylobacterium sp.]|uniref:prephenate dehydratase domain-containing protein n=1 Tax=Phenylobacterium sp. TaxID=1871053 RepID=UPI00273724F2